MAIDFKKKLATGHLERKTNPIELYNTLDRKSVAGPLRTAQQAILTEWYTNRKSDKDIIIKLHTGEGKTLVGLLILQSLLNSNEGPCLYVCPNKYLVKQVCAEAAKFGIPYCVIEEKQGVPNDFISGHRILITHVQKVFNGRSVFGVESGYTKVGAILLDDSHACIDTIRSAFTISIAKTKNEELYQKILTLFADDLAEQGEGSFLDIQSGDYNTFMPVPYWCWESKKTEVLKLLSAASNNEQVYFAWPFIRDHIKNYCCYISGTKIEISPYNADVSVFGSFSQASHRILMSATTQDDSFFVKGLDFNPQAVKAPLVNPAQKWSGEKMLIIPSLIKESCDRDLVVTSFSSMRNSKFGMVSLVPSTKFCKQYEDQGAVITTAGNIFSELDKLKNGHFSNLVVINNRYDGIDLPDESCRILILDGLPYFDSLSDRYEEQACPNSEIINKRIAQKIEQGIGRGVRGEKDYCAILIIGSELVRFMRSVVTNKYFSAQTRKQIDIGIEIADMACEDSGEDENTMDSILSLIKQMLTRDEGWKEYYISEMNTIEDYHPSTDIYERLLQERKIEQLFSDGEYEKACNLMQKLIDISHLDKAEKGWYLQQLARYQYPISAAQSIQTQKAAFKNNSQLLKPISGIEYTKLSYIHENRLNNIRNYIGRHENYNELVLAVDATLEKLSFGVEAEKFENALMEIGSMLGYISQRPDKEIRKGPDNLWCCANNHYLLFECKSEVSETRQAINKYEAGQMNNHCAWFEDQYGTAQVSRFMIIPTKELSYEGDFSHEVKIIRRGKLKKLKNSIKAFIKEFRSYDLQEIADETIQNALDIHHLNEADFNTLYSEAYYHRTN